MRTLIIPDIHENFARLKQLDDRIKAADYVVQLGDLFDCFGPEGWKEIIDWVLSHIDDEKFTFLIGNHDAGYYFNHQWFLCSGFKIHKKAPIREALLKYVGTKIKLETRVGPYCLTHAGWHPSTLKYRQPETIKEAIDKALNGEWHPVWSAGITRGGYEPEGGPIWLDWTHEFLNIPDFPQIVGHTPSFDIRKLGYGESKSYCIDTYLQKVAWFDDVTGKLTFEYTDPALNDDDK